MSGEPKFEVMYLDTEKNKIASLKGPDFSGQIDKLKSAIDHLLEKMEKFGLVDEGLRSCPCRCSS